jgi:mono/diheme cytochrome c family protein
MTAAMRCPVALLLLVAASACNSSPSDLREWRATDHDHTSEPSSGQVEVAADGGSDPELAAHGLDEVTLVAWQQNCTRCHGTIGRGDGPQGPSMRATDLTSGDWQKGATDAQISDAIKNGKGLMPRFALPDSTVAGLVRLIRLLDASRIARPPGSAAAPASALPAASVPANVRAAASASAKAKVSDPGQGHTAPAAPAPAASP